MSLMGLDNNIALNEAEYAAPRTRYVAKGRGQFLKNYFGGIFYEGGHIFTLRSEIVIRSINWGCGPKKNYPYHTEFVS